MLTTARLKSFAFEPVLTCLCLQGFRSTLGIDVVIDGDVDENVDVDCDVDVDVVPDQPARPPARPASKPAMMSTDVNARAFLLP